MVIPPHWLATFHQPNHVAQSDWISATRPIREIDIDERERLELPIVGAAVIFFYWVFRLMTRTPVIGGR